MGNRNRTSADSELKVITSFFGASDAARSSGGDSTDAADDDDVAAVVNGDGERIAFNRSIIDMSISVKHGANVKLENKTEKKMKKKISFGFYII